MNEKRKEYLANEMRKYLKEMNKCKYLSHFKYEKTYSSDEGTPMKITAIGDKDKGYIMITSNDDVLFNIIVKGINSWQCVFNNPIEEKELSTLLKEIIDND